MGFLDSGFARMHTVRQRLPHRGLPDVAAAVRAAWESSAAAARLRPGQTVAIGVGSRGIANYAAITKATVDYFLSHHIQCFLFPAMGSHGAATAEGQARVLAHAGITESAMGVPIRSQLEVVPLGNTEHGLPAFMDRLAYESDGVVLLNRIKWHTSFDGAMESGLFKMMAIGLGKFAGAEQYHRAGFRSGMEQVIRAVGRQVLQSGKMLGGLAILEGAHHETAAVHALLAGEMEAREPELLRTVLRWKAAIPLRQVDILVVDEIGKNISGTGMDTKIVNRGVQGEANHLSTAPRIERIYLRGVSAESGGIAHGIGMADVVHARALQGIDWAGSYVNALTAQSPRLSRLPMHFDSDRECLQRLAGTVGKERLADVTIARIRNTMELAELWVSANALDQLPKDAEVGPGTVAEFDGAGNLA